VIGTCNSVGAVPSILNGGIGYLMGQYSCGADNILSARIVLASGELAVVSAESNADLFWALCGAGTNFGIVTSLTVRAGPALNGGAHYSAMLAFAPDRLAAVVAAAAALEVQPDMGLNVLFIRAPPDHAPCVAAALWHPGSEAAARERFAPLFELGPLAVMGGTVPYGNLNDGLDYVCFKGSLCPHESQSAPFPSLVADRRIS
jgi:FAD/FMN-containing dehydrogenase